MSVTIESFYFLVLHCRPIKVKEGCFWWSARCPGAARRCLWILWATKLYFVVADCQERLSLKLQVPQEWELVSGY
jgi:hypothetical protein